MRLWVLLFAAALGLAPAVADAASYPDRPVTVIVPFPPGGASDITARLITQKMQESLGQPVVVSNRPGANGAIGAERVASAAPDGYTLLVGSIGVYAINPVLYKTLRYDPTKDFELLTVAVRTPNVLVTRPNFPANTVQELIAYLKKNPGKVTFASSGIGSSDHLTAALFWQKTGTTGLHVPYKGGAPAISDLMGGQADASFQNLGAVSNPIQGGTLKLLAVTGGQRVAAFPNSPTMKEAGVDGLEVYSWQAVAAPKGLPADVKAKLEDSIRGALHSADVERRFSDLGFEVVADTSSQFSTFLSQELARWKTVVETGNISAEQ